MEEQRRRRWRRRSRSRRRSRRIRRRVSLYFHVTMVDLFSTERELL
jgi:hypothetical protein